MVLLYLITVTIINILIDLTIKNIVKLIFFHVQNSNGLHRNHQNYLKHILPYGTTFIIKIINNNKWMHQNQSTQVFSWLTFWVLFLLILFTYQTDTVKIYDFKIDDVPFTLKSIAVPFFYCICVLKYCVKHLI